MRIVVQKVTSADVSVAGEEVARISRGLMVLVGVQTGDTEADARYIAEKIADMRIFEDADDKLNLSVRDTGGEVLLVSQFTLLGEVSHGRRPSFIAAAAPAEAEPLCERVRALLAEAGVSVRTGRFRTHMAVSLVNDGPVTILLDSRARAPK